MLGCHFLGLSVESLYLYATVSVRPSERERDRERQRETERETSLFVSCLLNVPATG